MRKHAIVILVILLVVILLTGCTKKEEKKEQISDAIKFKEEYEALNGKTNDNNKKKYPRVDIPDDNVVKYASIDKMLEILDKGTGVLYFGFPNCPWCRNAVPVLLNAATSTGVEDIYYLNVLDVRDNLVLDDNGEVITDKEGKKGYKELLDKMYSILDDYALEDETGNEVKTGEKRIYVPLVVFVKDGKIIDYHMDTVESQKDPYIVLNEKQTEELYNIYVEGILKMQDSACDESC